jgi:acyl-CoA reductase-like NAD-dependent aldehyde dehydrogenase
VFIRSEFAAMLTRCLASTRALLVGARYASVPAFADEIDDNDDEISAAETKRLAEAHVANCKRAIEHIEKRAKMVRRQSVELFKTNAPEVRKLFEPESITHLTAEVSGYQTSSARTTHACLHSCAHARRVST